MRGIGIGDKVRVKTEANYIWSEYGIGDVQEAIDDYYYVYFPDMDIVGSFYDNSLVLVDDTLNEPEDAFDNDFAISVTKITDTIAGLLIDKNRKYGNSALGPKRIFAKSDAIEQIKVRIDDKLSRIKNEQGDEDEDVVLDLIGYLVLLLIAKEK